MAHIRTQVRGDILTALQAMTTPTSVVAERRLRIADAMRPLVIFSLADSTVELELAAMGNPAWTVETSQQVIIELHASGETGSDVADVLDQLEVEAEAALQPVGQTSAVLDKLEPVSSTLEMSVETDRVTGVRTLVWSAIWRHVLGDPETAEG